MKKIHFIVNPIAGKGSSKIDEAFLSNYFEKDLYTIRVKKSQFKKHSIALTRESIEEGAEIIIACGGDGTINEVASCLIGTAVTLGIIPLGSGNGLASNLKIPRNIKAAISIIKKMHADKIDVGRVNSSYFFSNVGFGFDAAVIRNYEAYGNHKLWCYLKAFMKSLANYTKNEKFEVRINEEEVIANPFLIFISNSNEMGYKMSLTPKASLQDGLLDVVIVPKIGKAKILLLGVLILFKRIELLKEVKCFKTREMILMKKQGTIFDSQIDGESEKIIEPKVNIKIQHNALRILA